MAERPPMSPPPEGKVEEDEEISPVPQVAMTVPTTDDPSLPVYTFRMWVLGTLSCIILSFLNQFFFYRSSPLTISSIAAQIAVVPIGHLMARTLPTTKFLKGTRFEFSLNPGPFNIKEHVLITIFANSGAGNVYGMHIVTAVKAFYKKEIGFFVSFIIQITTQVLGFGWAGIFRKYLVLPGEMWWPGNLVQVSLFGALHEKARRPKGSLSRNQFFLVVLMASFAYYVFPGYLFTMLTSLSFVCWALPKSTLAQQIGSGASGLGIGSIALDWATASSYLGSPLASPWFASANILAGYVLIMYFIVPVSYWLDIFKAKNFPIYSALLFNSTGAHYKIESIVNDRFELDIPTYEKKGPVYLSTFFAMTYGTGFATLTATVVHVALFHGHDIMAMTRSAISKQKVDIHTKLMSKYKQVPEWWFLLVLAINLAVAFLACHFYKDTLQLPIWGVVLACLIALFFTLPIGIISATTNQTPGLNIITEYIIGYMYPGRPVANVLFKVYGYISMVQALTFLADFKLGHYMKIPPRAMFTAQMVGTVIAVLVYLVTGWWLLETVPDICELKTGNQWTCPSDRTFYDASVIWGLVGPRRIFGNLGNYNAVNWYFLAGAIAPCIVYFFHRLFPQKNWIRLINMPLLLSATAMMPPASAVNYTTWLAMAFISGYIVLRRYPEWWKRHNYVLSGAMEAGVGFMGVLLYFTLQSKGVGITWWGNEPDGCPLASCPTSKEAVHVDGCPVIS